MLGQLRAAEELAGPDVVKRALDRIPREAAAELSSLLAISWCSLDTLRLFHEAVADLVPQELGAWRMRVIEVATRETFSTTLRFFLRLTTQDALVKRSAAVYAKIFDVGTMQARAAGEGVSIVQFTGWPDASAYHLDGLAMGIVSLLKVAKIEPAKVKWTRTPEGADFEVRTSRTR